MNIISEVITELFGNYKVSFYITYTIIVGLGTLLSARVYAKTRDKNSTTTPTSFSWKFLLQDNLIRFLGSMAFVFASIRFGEDIFNVVPTYAGAFMMGFSFDQALVVLEKFQFKARE
ncbi:MAG: hypothetical protein [Caudoviricetes sp.]|nr:MAG: hypothetical protein [Caudoviricetes sp.]